jgi:inorganic pyrophosphatase
MKHPISRLLLKFTLSTLLILIVLPGCGNKQMRNFNTIPPFSRNNVNVVVEVPAGTNRMIVYNEEKKMFLPGERDGSDWVVDFLPCPGNFGFVPGTYLDPVMGGNGDPVNVLVISESVPTGTVMEVKPLLVLYFNDGSIAGGGLSAMKIIAVPASERFRVINAGSYQDLFDNYPDLVDILVKWFSSYKGSGTMKLTAMGDGDVAMNEIRKWDIRRY